MLERRFVNEITPDDVEWLDNKYIMRMIAEEGAIELYADKNLYHVFVGGDLFCYRTLPKDDPLSLFCYLHELRVNCKRTSNELLT